MAWDARLYLNFARERKQPCVDLLSRLNGDFNRILDLGCGPGNSTEELLKKYSKATIIGLDADDNMLEKARHDHPEVEFVKGRAPMDFHKLTGKFDLVFSNACIHWIDEQEKLIAEVYRKLNDNGVFAVQIPLTSESQFYKILYRLVEQKWTKLKEIKNFRNWDSVGYYNVLTKQFKSIAIWRSDYYHVVDKSRILEWYQGSGLRPYLAALQEGEQKEFLKDLQESIDKEYSVLEDGNVFLIMPRLFFTAEK